MNKIVKLVIAAALIIGSVFLFKNGDVWWGVLLVMLAIVSILLYFFNENIIMAFLRLRKQDIEGAKKWMSKIKNPEKQLTKFQMGYYHYMLGITNAQDNLNESVKQMKKALSYGLPFGHDRAMAKVNIAADMLRKGNKKEAKRLLKEARADDKQGMMASQIDMVESQIKKVNVSKNPRMQQMQRKGRYF